MSMLKSSIVAAMLLVGTVNAGEVLATVNGVAINKSDIDTSLQSRGMSFDKLPASQQKQILDRLIERELLVATAKKDGIENDPEYKKDLENLKKDLLIKAWMGKVYKKTLISDSEANKYYQDNKDKYKEPAKVHARHILVKTEDEANKLIDELKNLKGEELKKKFIELAKTKSTGPSGKNGGDLGYFTKGQMVKPFEEATFGMKKGEVSAKPVKTQFGYHIIYVEDKKDASVAPFEKVKKQIIAKLRQEQFNKAIKNTLDKMKKDSKIDIKIDAPKDANATK